MKKIIFISDFFENEYLGGAEKNDGTLIFYLQKKGFSIDKVKTSEIDLNFLQTHKKNFFIISNFMFLKTCYKAFLSKECKYLIYEHDYKFVKNRNPLLYKEYLIKKSDFCNVNFLKSAKKIVCLSNLHKQIHTLNLPNLNNIATINCSLFDDKTLDYLYDLHKNRTNLKEEVAIIKSSNPIKKTNESIDLAKRKNLNYSLFSDSDYHTFLKKMSTYKKIIILSGHPEPTPRTAVEAKILGLKIIANKKNIGVANEYWWKYEGEELVKEIKKIRSNAINMIEEIINED